MEEYRLGEVESKFAEIIWADLSELKTMDFPPADIPVLDFLTHAV